MAENLAIYVHWPWCKAKCPYCDFNSHALKNSDELGAMGARYVAAISAEIRHWRARGIGAQRDDVRVGSVFFGGGTPSLMQPVWVQEILEKIEENWAFSGDCEVTVECNPTSSSRQLFEGLRTTNVNRVSVGVQGLRAENLGFLGREHNVAEALATLEDAVDVIGNVNADVMYGLPGQDVRAWEEELARLAAMKLTHLSAYQLTVEMNTAFYAQVARGEWTPLDSDAQADFFEATHTVLGEAGFENYEISNYAKAGLACRHNVAIWRYQPYLGLGAGAHGRLALDKVYATSGNGIRDEDSDRLAWVATQNRKMPDKYMEDMEKSFVWDGLITKVKPVDAVQEALMMGLRLREGVNVTALQKRFGMDAWKEALENGGIQRFLETGLLWQDKTHLGVTQAGWGRLDGVLRGILKAPAM